MKAERKSLVWAVLVVEAFLVPALIAFAILAIGCNNGVTINYPGGGGNNTGDNGTTTGIVESGETDSGNNTDTDNSNDENSNIDSDDNDIDGDGSVDGDSETGNTGGAENENDDTGSSTPHGTEGENNNDENDNNTDTGNENHTIYPLLTSIAEASEYLTKQTGGTTVDTPIHVSLQIDLGRMMVDSNWPTLLKLLDTQGKYVELDLSHCTVNGGVFAPRAIIAVYGKDKIVSLTLPDTATSIAVGSSTDTNAFIGFSNLTTVSLPENMVSIGNYAFANCTNLTDCIINAVTPPELGTNVFYNTYPTLKIYVPPESVNLYKNAPGWKDHASNIVPQ